MRPGCETEDVAAHIVKLAVVMRPGQSNCGETEGKEKGRPSEI